MSAEPTNPSIWNLFTGNESDRPPEDEPSFWSLFTTDEKAEAKAVPSVAMPPRPSAGEFDEQRIFWAMRHLPVAEALKHLAVLGVTGGGKSTMVQLLLQSIAPRFRRSRSKPEQLILFDGKCDAVTQLASLGLYPEDKNVHILNPFDERCSVWDMCAETDTPLKARNLASLLVPEEKQSTSPFFSESACDLIYAVMLGLNRAGTPWTFRDLICALDTKERMEAITARDPRGKFIFQRIFSDDKHAFGVHSSLGSKIVRFEQVAALWHSAPKTAKKFTLKEFLSKPGVLILGDHPKLHASLWPINALLMKALTEEILSNPEDTRQPRHWFVLDEFPVMEQVACVPDLLRRGRSKGVCVMLGAQGIESLSTRYGADGTEDMLSQCAYKTFLRSGGPKTAKWAEQFFGQVRTTEANYSESWSKDGRSCSVSYHTTERFLILAATFLNLPLPQRGGWLVSVSDVPCLEASYITRRWFDEVLSWLELRSTIPALLPRTNVDEQTLQPWTPEEEKDFAGIIQSKSKKKKSKQKKRSAAAKGAESPAYLPGVERRSRKQLPPDF